jgi:hypothetical protein
MKKQQESLSANWGYGREIEQLENELLFDIDPSRRRAIAEQVAELKLEMSASREVAS